MKQTSLVLTLLMVLSFTACDSNNSNSGNELSGVIVLNEGNFGQSNASITAYNMETKVVTQNSYENENGVPIGDVLQSVTEINDRLYFSINNSNKIEVVDKESLKKIASIQLGEGGSPRTIAQVNDTKAYITSLYGNSVIVISLTDNTVSKSINVGQNPEGIAVVGNRAYVANSGFGNGNTVSVINTDTDKVIETITVADNPSSVVAQSNGNVWVVCVGAYGDWNNPDDNGTPGEIYILNGSTGSIVANFEVGGHPGDLVLSEKELKAYLANGGAVMQIDMNTYTISNAAFIERGFYALGLSTSDNGDFLWATDAKNFAQSGLALQYNLEGAKLDSFPTGIIPGGFYFITE